MTHAVQYELNDELKALFEAQQQGNSPLSTIKVGIDFDGEKFMVASTVPLGADAESDFAKAKALLG